MFGSYSIQVNGADNAPMIYDPKVKTVRLLLLYTKIKKDPNKL